MANKNNTTRQTKLPSGWKWVKLGEVCEFVYGSSLPQQSRIEGNIPVYGSNGIIGYHNEPLTNGPTIIIGRKGSIGEVNFSSKPCFPIDTTYFIEQEHLNADINWFAYLLKKINLREMNKAAAVPGLNRNDVYNLEIPLPPLPQQKRIAGILTKQMAAAAKAKEACQGKLAAAEKLPASFLNAIFNSDKAKQWPMKKLEEVCEFKNGINFGADQKGAGILTVDVLNMYSNSIHILADHLYRVDVNLSDDYLLQVDDILIVRSSVKREGVGWPSLFTGYEEPMTFCGFIIRARLITDRLFSQFIIYYLRQEHIRDQVIGKSGTGTITNISQSNLKQVSIPLPPLPEQKRIAGILTKQMAAAAKAKEAIKEELELINKLPASLLQQAFTGKL